MARINATINQFQAALPHIRFWHDEHENIRYEGKRGTHFYVDGHGYYPELDEVDAATINALCIGGVALDLQEAVRDPEPRGVVRIKKYIGINACSAGREDYTAAMNAAGNNVNAAIDWAFDDDNEVGYGHRAWILEAVLEMLTPDDEMLAELTAQFPLAESYSWVSSDGSLYVGLGSRYWCESCQSYHDRDERYDSDLFDYVDYSMRAPLLKYLVSKVS